MATRQWRLGGATAALSRGVWIASAPLAAFDFDGTLAVYRRKPEAGGAQCWRSRVSLSLLSGLVATRRFNVAIISNRSPGSELAPLLEYVAELDRRCDGIAAVWVVAASGHNRWRKPHLASLEWLETEGGPITPGSFYCGDAGGRPGDFAASDHAFAHNAALAGHPIKFVHADELFAGSQPFRLGSSSLRSAPIDAALAVPPRAADALPTDDWKRQPTLVLLMGAPASGKSRLAGDVAARICDPHLRTAPVLCQDDLSTSQFAAALRAALAARRSFVVDGQNRTAAVRRVYRDHAYEHDMRMACIEVATPREVCFHLNEARLELGGRHVPEVAIHTYFARKEEVGDDEKTWRDCEWHRYDFAPVAAAPPQVMRWRYSWRGQR